MVRMGYVGLHLVDGELLAENSILRETQLEIVFTARRRVELREMDAEEAPLGPDEVAGRTLVTLVSPGTEINARFLGDDFPQIAGYASVFEIEAKGESIDDLKRGNLVFAPGRHRSRQRFRRCDVLPVPEGLAPETAVFARLMGVSMTTLATTEASPGAKVVVTGLGPIGHVAAQIFASCGYEVAACDPDEKRRRLAQAKGISTVWDRIPSGDPDWQDRVSLVLECSGHEQTVLDGCRIVRKGGEVVLVATPWRQNIDASVHTLQREVFLRYVTLRSGWEGQLPEQPGDFARSSRIETYATALQWLRERRVCVEGLFAKSSPAQAQKVYDDLLHKENEGITTVFDWTALNAPLQEST
jgi:NADPH:quinone reductase-like Zn-dependent oxidoreductase